MVAYLYVVWKMAVCSDAAVIADFDFRSVAEICLAVHGDNRTASLEYVVATDHTQPVAELSDHRSVGVRKVCS